MFIYNYVMASSILMLNAPSYVVSFTYEKLVIIVPNEWTYTGFTIGTILKSPLLSVWTLSILLFTLLRKILQIITETKSTRQTLSNVLFDTFGRTFGNSAYTIENRPERILIIFLLISALLADILCTGMLFEQYATKQWIPRINSLADFLAHRGERLIMIPNMYEHEDHYEKQLGNTKYVDEFKIMSYIYDGNLSNLYLLPETRAMQLFNNDDQSNGAKHFHIIPDTYMC